MNTHKQCTGWKSGGIAPHAADEIDFNVGKNRCKACTSAYFKAWQAKKALQGRIERVQPQPQPEAPRQTVAIPTSDAPVAMKHDLGHTYRPNAKLVALWDAVVTAADAGEHIVLAMHGPQGSGKTDGAEFLAQRANRPMIKVDAKSVIDAEAWFGTRGAVEGSTFYSPSEFVKAIQMRSVVFIDEYTRVTNEVRDVLNPLMDGTRTVLNPITGERIKVHPECIIVLGGNVGFKHTGTFDVDPATTSRLAVFNVDYPDPDTERAILIEHSKIEHGIADALVRFAVETRANPQMQSVSTRELLQASVLISRGLSMTEAVEAKVINAASDQGGATSPRARLATLWGGYVSTNTTEDVFATDAAEVL